nr:hypothetical protein [Tanacetum cinerariifolium]
MHAFVKNHSTTIYTTGWTWKDVRGLTDDQLQNRSGETLESSDSKKLKSSHSTEQSAKLHDTTYVSAGATIAASDPISAVPSVFAASSIPAETPIPTGVSTTAGVFELSYVPIIDLLDYPPKATSLPLDPATAEQAIPLRKSTRKKSMARRKTLPRHSQSESAALPFDVDDPEAKFKKYLRQVFDDDEPAEPVSLSLVSDIRTWEIIPTEFGLGEIYVITRADGTVKRFSTLREHMHWVGRANLMVLYAGDIMYMFVDKKYPILPATIQRMLNHGLEIDRVPSDLLKVYRALTMSARVLNYPAFKLEEIVMAMMTCLKSSGVHYQCFTVECGLLWYLSCATKQNTLSGIIRTMVSIPRALYKYAAIATSYYCAFNPHTLHMTIYYWKLDNKQVTIQFRGGLLGIVIPTARVFCSCCQFFISVGVLFLLLEYSVPAVRKEELENGTNDESARSMKEGLTGGETKVDVLVEMPRKIKICECLDRPRIRCEHSSRVLLQ